MPNKTIVDFANQVKSYALGIKDQQVLGAWNLMPMTLPSQSINGLTITVDSDNVIDINGTASKQTILVLKRKIGTLMPGKTYYLSGITGGSLNTYFMTYNNDSESLYYINLCDGFGEFTAVDESTYPSTFVALYIRSGVTMNHVKVKPMISLEPNQPYVPHAMTNRELTEGQEVVYGTPTYGENISSDSTNAFKVIRYGKMKILQGRINPSVAISGVNYLLLTLPEGFRPSETVYPQIACVYNGSDTLGNVQISTNGQVKTFVGGQDLPANQGLKFDTVFF